MIRSILTVVTAFFVSHSAPRATAQEAVLELGRPTTGSLTVEATEVVYTLEVEADHFVRGTVEQDSVNVEVRVEGPKGSGISVRIDERPRGAERFHFEARKAGTYRIEVTAAEASADGSGDADGGEDGDTAGSFTTTLTTVEPVSSDPVELANQLLSAYDYEDSPGACVSVFRDGEVLFAKACGMADLTHGIPFRLETRTNIGSTSKQFTAFAILLLEGRGELSLDDDVRDHLPELPDLGEVVRVRHLLTHTTGYREFLNLLRIEGRQLGHGDWVDRSEVLEIVQRQPALQSAPGSRFSYNNSAYALAALIVERISGMDFDEFMASEVFGPLSMTRTMVRPTPEHIVPGRSLGYGPSGDGFLELRDLGGAVGAGGIYATVGDLQKWIENMIDPKLGSRDLFDRMMTPNELSDGNATEYGLGLFIDEQKGLRRVHHGGADIAHRSQLAYYPEIRAGITTQSNHAGFDTSIAFRLAEAFFADAMEADPVAAEAEEDASEAAPMIEFEPEWFDEFVGRYALDPAPDRTLTFSREEDVLWTQMTGQPKLKIVPASRTRFDLVDVEASLEFVRDGSGAVVAVTLFQNGGELRASRLGGEVPVQWQPTDEELEAFTGRYLCDEIETFIEAVLEDGRLVLKHRRLGDLELEMPTTKDVFSQDGMEVAFERDRNDRVIGFYVSDGRVKNVRFGRLQ